MNQPFFFSAVSDAVFKPLSVCLCLTEIFPDNFLKLLRISNMYCVILFNSSLLRIALFVLQGLK